MVILELAGRCYVAKHTAYEKTGSFYCKPDLSRISKGVNTSPDFGGSSCLDGRPESGNRLHYTQQPNFSNRVDLCNSYRSIIDHRQNPYCDRNLHDSPGPSSFQEYAENPGHLNAGGVYTRATVKPFNSKGTHPAPQKHSRHRDQTHPRSLHRNRPAARGCLYASP